MKKILLGSLLLFVLSGCASRQNIIEHSIGSFPEKLKLTEANTGEKIYSEHDYISTKGARLVNSLNFKKMLAEINASPLNKLIAIKTNNETMYCSTEKLIKQVLESDFLCLKDSNNDFVFDEWSNLYAISWDKINGPNPKYEIIDYKINEGKKVELLYNGFSNKTINLEYREYINNIARPSFYQNLQYNYDGTPIEIRYKHIKIKIFEANNNSIKYKILEK